MKRDWLIAGACLAALSLPAQADVLGEDLIPELRDIERIAAEQEAAIRAQSDVLKKAQQEKEALTKVAEEATAKQAAEAAAAQQVIARQAAERRAAQNKATATPAAATTAKKTTPQPARKPATTNEPNSPWLAQERRYSYP